ncbi:MAG TPA: hypothetical protein VFG29_01520 [Syntrophales bacterium]|nr:hypothetical protein [Syntrophales bacterium]
MTAGNPIVQNERWSEKSTPGTKLKADRVSTGTGGPALREFLTEGPTLF